MALVMIQGTAGTSELREIVAVIFGKEFFHVIFSPSKSVVMHKQINHS